VLGRRALPAAFQRRYLQTGRRNKVGGHPDVGGNRAVGEHAAVGRLSGDIRARAAIQIDIDEAATGARESSGLGVVQARRGECGIVGRAPEQPREKTHFITGLTF
jgi:hypothetical protein